MKIDLNSDLGESLGGWRMGDDAAMLDIVSSANVACGFHAGDPAGILETLKAARARRHRRRPCVLSRPGRLRPAQHGRGQRRPGGRRHLPDRRAAGPGPRGRHRGALRQAARRALQHHRPRQAPGHRRDHGHARHRPQPGAGCAGRLAPDRLGARRRPDRGGRGLCRPRLHARGHPGLAPRSGRRAARRGPDRRAHAHAGARRGGRGRGRQPVRIAADSICVHGDSPGAVAIARHLRERFEQEGVRISSFAG